MLGGITVLLDLHPATVAAHFLLSMLMIAAPSRSIDGRLSPPTSHRTRKCDTSWLGGARHRGPGVDCAVLGTIVTGTGPHSETPTKSCDLDSIARTISWLHADAVLVFLGLALAYTFGCSLSNAPRACQTRWTLLVAACVVKGSIGYSQYFTGLPVGLVSPTCSVPVWSGWRL